MSRGALPSASSTSLAAGSVEQRCALFRGQPGRGDAQQVVGEAVFLARGVGLHEFPSAAHHVVERLYPRIEEQSVACGVCQVVVFQDFGLLPEIEQHAVVAVRGQVCLRALLSCG